MTKRIPVLKMCLTCLKTRTSVWAKGEASCRQISKPHRGSDLAMVTKHRQRKKMFYLPNQIRGCWTVKPDPCLAPLWQRKWNLP
jgi:hypothetical protein